MAKVAAKAKDRPVKKKQTVGMKILTILFSIVSVFYVAPVFIVLMNSFKSNAAISRAIFEFPNADSFQGFQSYMTGIKLVLWFPMLERIISRARVAPM